MVFARYQSSRGNGLFERGFPQFACVGGAAFFKTDFMFWGLQDGGRWYGPIKRQRTDKISVEYLRELFTAIRAAIGEESYWLGCIAPFVPMIGFCDGMRVSADVCPGWSAGHDMPGIVSQMAGFQHLNGVWWQDDPDAIFLRDFHLDLTEQEV